MRLKHRLVHFPGVPPDVGQRLLWTVHGPPDAFQHRLLDLPDQRRVQAVSGGDPPQGDRQSRFFLPPGPEIHHRQEPGGLKGETAFVNDYPAVGLSGRNGLENPIVGGEHPLAGVRRPQPKQQVGGGPAAGQRNPAMWHVRTVQAFSGDQHRAAAEPHGRPAAKQPVSVFGFEPGVKGELGDVQRSPQGQFVEGLHIMENRLHPVSGHPHVAAGNGVEHIGVIGTGGIAECQFLDHGFTLSAEI